MAILDVRDLTLHYETPRGPVRAVDGISFEVAVAGHALGIIGETGSGKSSLVAALTRVLPRNVGAYSGEVYFDGEDIMLLRDEEMRRRIRWKRISVVFQGAMNTFNPVVRMGVQVGERMLAETHSSRQAVRKRSADLFRLVGLTDENLGRFPHELSGGMKQRAAIAMALTMDPDVVILDEPTSALDVSVQAQIINLLKRLKWELGLSMLFITHDIALASDISDSLAVIHAGELREYGTAEDVLLRPADPYTQALVGSIPRLHGDQNPAFVSGAPPDPADLPTGCRFSPRCPHVFDTCRSDPPPLLQVGAGHHARCWLYDPRYRDSTTAAGFTDGGAG